MDSKTYTSRETKYSAGDVCRMNFTQQQYVQEVDFIQNEMLPSSSDDCDGRLSPVIVDSNDANVAQEGLSRVQGEMPPVGSDNSDSKLKMTERQAREKTFLCDICGRGFSQKKGLTVHLRTHSGESHFSCEVCDKNFVSKERLRSHLVVHSQDKRFDCDLCGKKFLRKQQMQHHRILHTGEKPHICEVCHKAFPLKQRLRKHMSFHFEERPFSCDQCDKKFQCRRVLNVHKSIHTGEKPFVCEFCPDRFRRPAHLRKHLRAHTGEKLYHCHACPMQYANRDSFLKHIHTHEDPPKLFKCENCGKEYMSENRFNFHRCARTRKEPFTCKTCLEEFSEESELEEHRRHHKREKPFACSICGLRFFRSPNLKLHLSIIHPQPKPLRSEKCDLRLLSDECFPKHWEPPSPQFACDPCRKTFDSKKELESHNRVHLPIILPSDENFVSIQHENTSNHLEYLRHHVLSFFEKKQYYCELCSKKFTDRYYLIRHKQIHAGGKPDVCPVCRIQYFSLDSFLNHVHNDKQRSMNFVPQSSESNDSLRVEMSFEEHISDDGNDVSSDDGRECAQNKKWEKQISTEYKGKIFKEERGLKSVELSSVQCVLSETYHFSENVGEKEMPRNKSIPDSEVTAIDSQFFRVKTEKCPDEESNPLSCDDAEEKEFKQNHCLLERKCIGSASKSYVECCKRFPKQETLNL